MGTQDQSSGNKPNQTNQPGQQGTSTRQQEQRKDRENQPGGHEKGSGQQGGGTRDNR